MSAPVRFGVFTMTWRTPTSVEIDRGILRLYALTDESGSSWTVTEYQERRNGRPVTPLSMIYECSCHPGTWGYECAHTQAVRHGFPHDPPPRGAAQVAA
jgi:hypothetical protein